VLFFDLQRFVKRFSYLRPTFSNLFTFLLGHSRFIGLFLTDFLGSLLGLTPLRGELGLFTITISSSTTARAITLAASGAIR
jgi:hypothetical protein